ncbi:type IX secretion system periplasmic lipoprotein PorW/SprE [Pontibacter beigongshangensis]|uniref:type IX secretion system periplasmic lipoprotein PorW/SprE n=1 Tax=Pontibacter beigongshangensis TaxID=2574733 RepID=UPI00164F7595|nr:tetratricopeptide repeat protein [Pontibacter beigongshangensis]
MNKLSLYILFVVAGLALAACSVERNNPISKAYHNTSARYNGYFLAKEKLRLLEEILQEQMAYDYNLALPIYPSIDSATAKAFAADLEDIVKKASFPIQYHKNSKWIDDCYVLIGKVRYYQLNFADAARTFKYVNSISKDNSTRHEAHIWLMRSFMMMEEMENAQAVSDYLRKERLNRENARELYLARAHYNRLLGDTAAVIENLTLSLRNFKKKDDLARARFSLAMLLQATEQDKEAYQQYSKILRRNPPYDLGFFSRLYMGQVAEVGNSNDIERIAGYYRKMLKDGKNTEYRDKIFYEMAQFELRQNNHGKALEHLNTSLRTPGTIPNQKAYSYLLAGAIYFDLNKYNPAQAYYDSAVQVLPQQAANYEAVSERRNILTEFTFNYNTIQTQDSLQRIGRLPEAERVAFVTQLVQAEEERRQQEMARLQEQAQFAERQASSINQNQNNATGIGTATNTGGVWYFDNPTAMASARSEFNRRWGDRPLQDNWRLRLRGESSAQEQVAQQQQTTEEPTAAAESPEDRIASQVQTYLQNVPVTAAALQESDKQVEESMFNLANIYAQKLQDHAKAAETYEQLLQRFPKTEHAAESYYSLYLLYSKTDDERKTAYYNKIKQQFPNSTFAQLVDDPDFMSKNAADNILAHQLYDTAFKYYEQQDYQNAADQLAQLSRQYPLNDIKDKVAYLGVLITARTDKPEVLQEQLYGFIADYPSSPLKAKADQLLLVYNELAQKNQLRQEAPSAAAAAVQEQQPPRSLTPEERINAEMALATASAAQISPQPIQQPQAAETESTASTTENTANPVVPAPATAAQAPAEAVQPDTVQQPAATPAATNPGTEPQVPAPAAAAEPVEATAPEPAIDPLEYVMEQDTAYYFVLVYPADAPAFKDIDLRYDKYNNTYYKKQNLEATVAAFTEGQAMLTLSSFDDYKEAQSFNIKQKAPQAPVGRIRGVSFTTFVISAANYQRLLEKKDLEAYLTFLENNN